MLKCSYVRVRYSRCRSGSLSRPHVTAPVADQLRRAVPLTAPLPDAMRKHAVPKSREKVAASFAVATIHLLAVLHAELEVESSQVERCGGGFSATTLVLFDLDSPTACGCKESLGRSLPYRYA
jgi:hypothetical protein